MDRDEPTRLETDLLGSMSLPSHAYFGINTARSVQNFSVSRRPLGSCRPLVSALATVKSAAALANGEIGALDAALVAAVVEACSELAAGRYDAHLVCDVLEGSGGTSVNMNVNEVIANAALVKLGAVPGDYARLHPNDHVNLSQSTNDVVPTAVRLAIFEASGASVDALRTLADALAVKRDQFSHVLHLGRTCMQDAQPMTLGQAFGGYAAVIRRHAEQLKGLRQTLLALPIGGTAIGTGLGTRAGYRSAVIKHLQSLVGHPVQAADDAFDAMQNADDCARLSAELKVTANSLWKIGNDLVLLSSGPEGGLGEIRLPEVQAGSSIMPGKVNPVLPMTVCQVALAVCGNDLAVTLAAQQGLLELNHYELLIVDRILDSTTMMTGAVSVFTRDCIDGIEANEERCWAHLRDSSALATALVPQLGYDHVCLMVQGARSAGRAFIDHALAEGWLTDADVRSTLYEAAMKPE
jgi:aspartate ammonia-lyase